MIECENCGAHLEYKTRRDITQPKKQKFFAHPKGGCHKYIKNKLKNRCNLFDQDFKTSKICIENCGSQIYCFETQLGSTPNKTYFTTPGPPWIKHDCKTEQNLAEEAGEFKPCVIDRYVSINLPFKQRFLGFLIQIETDGLRQKALIMIQMREDNKQFVHHLHQPFFYKIIDLHNWILNTYQINPDANGILFCAPKEYRCRKIDHESISGWKKKLGDDNQLPLFFD